MHYRGLLDLSLPLLLVVVGSALIAVGIYWTCMAKRKGESIKYELTVLLVGVAMVVAHILIKLLFK